MPLQLYCCGKKTSSWCAGQQTSSFGTELCAAICETSFVQGICSGTSHTTGRTCQEEHVRKLEIQKKDEENQQLKQKVTDLEETLLRIQEENLRLVSELQKCQEHLKEKDEQLEHQALELQEERGKHEKKIHLADEKMQNLEASAKGLEDLYVKMVKMAVDRELELQVSEKAISSKEEEIFKLQDEVSTLLEQRHEDKEKLNKAHQKICELEGSLKSLEVSYMNMVKMAVDRELQLQECQDKMSSKDREILMLEFELSKIKKQRAVKDFQFAIEPGGIPSEVSV